MSTLVEHAPALVAGAFASAPGSLFRTAKDLGVLSWEARRELMRRCLALGVFECRLERCRLEKMLQIIDTVDAARSMVPRALRDHPGRPPRSLERSAGAPPSEASPATPGDPAGGHSLGRGCLPGEIDRPAAHDPRSTGGAGTPAASGGEPPRAAALLAGAPGRRSRLPPSTSGDRRVGASASGHRSGRVDARDSTTSSRPAVGRSASASSATLSRS